MSSVSAPRKQAARLPRPAARYWKGRAPKGVDAAPSDSEEEEDEQVEVGEEGDVPIEDVEEDEGLEMRVEAAKPAAKGINVALRDVNISREGKVTIAGKAEVGRTAAELGA